MNQPLSRRDFLNKLSIAGAAFSTSAFLNACALPAIKTNSANISQPPDIELSLTAKADTAQIFSGKPTSVWRYHGEVLKGPQDAVQSIPGSYLGPTLHFTTGQLVRIHFYNQLDEPSIIHWHGLHVPESADGHPRLVIDPGEEYVYDFTINDRAGMYWCHPHPHGRTGPQVYYGLAGLIIIHDEEEASLGLPDGEYILPIVIQDRSFDDQNQLIYGENHMTQMMGFFGDQILINGLSENQLSVENRPYRLRLLNGSNARIYKLAWSDAAPFTVIGTDGGLLEKPLERDSITLAPAQRVDLWVDFSKYTIPSSVTLINISNDTPGGRDRYGIMTFNVAQTATTSAELPPRLSNLKLYNRADARNGSNPRDFSLQMGMGMIWNINGRTFEMEAISNDEKVRLGDLEVWQFTNSGASGMGMNLPHPMHIHGLQFQILEREVDNGFLDSWQTISGGLVDEGWHDTVLVMPGEKVQVLLRFEDYEGLYLYHCHNLEHEDMGMMRNYLVEA